MSIFASMTSMTWRRICGISTPSARLAVQSFASSTRGPSGYNYFVKEMFQKPEIKSMPSGERLPHVVAAWRGMTEAQKAEWKSAAQSLNAQQPNLSADAVSSESAPRRMTGYMCFLKEAYRSEDVQKLPVAERFSKIGAKWKAMSETEKSEWKTKAASMPAAEASSSSKKAAARRRKDPSGGSSHMTGWTLFLKETHKTDEIQKVQASERMKHAAAKWRALSKAEQQQWNAAAKEWNQQKRSSSDHSPASVTQATAPTIAPPFPMEVHLDDVKKTFVSTSKDVHADKLKDIPKEQQEQELEKMWNAMDAATRTEWVNYHVAVSNGIA